MFVSAALGMGLIWLVLGMAHASRVLDEGAQLFGRDTATDRLLPQAGAHTSYARSSSTLV